jgi:hypothetical protein
MTRDRDEQFRVYLHDRSIGLLHRRGDFSRFVFDEHYLTDPHRAMLGLRFEESLRARHGANMRLPPWFSNQGDRFTAPAVGTGGDWIVKLPDPKYPEVPRNEFVMMTLAGAAGNEVPEVKLVHRDQIESLPADVWKQGEENAYAVRRFDRGNRRELISYRRFCAGAWPLPGCEIRRIVRDAWSARIPPSRHSGPA